MTLSTRVAAATYLLKRLVLKGEAQRFAPSGEPATRPDAPPEHGVVDAVASGAVRGWARRLDNPETLVRVDVYLGEEFLGRATCNRVRGDLASLPGFHTSGRHGFEFPLPEDARRLGGRLRVVAADSGLELTGSPMIFEGDAPPEVVEALPGLLSKVWNPGPQPYGVVSLAQIEAAYGRRLAVLAEIDPEAQEAAWPVTRAMSYVNARNHAGLLPVHGSRACFELLLAAAAHFAPARAGLPMDAVQVAALAKPTGWLLDGQVRSSQIMDAFARTRKIEAGTDETSVAAFLTAFVVEALAQHRLPLDLLGADAAAFLRGDAPQGGGTLFEVAFAASPVFAGMPPASGSATAAAAVRLAAWDLGLQDLVGASPRPPAPPPSTPQPCRQGVRIITGDHGESGLSLNARNSRAALEAIGVETRVDSAPVSTLASAASYDHFAQPCFSTALLHLPPHDAVEVIVRLPPEQAGAHLIGFFMWETETLPQAHSLGVRLVDNIWTATRYCEEIFRAAVPDTRVQVVGHAVRLAEPEPGFDARAWARVRPDDFVFLFHFDAHSWITRKNPVALVRAFRRAFGPGETRVRLVVKLRRSEDWAFPQWRAWWEAFFEEAERDPRIVLLRETLSDARMSALTRAADAFVSLHRSEGFGYGLAEAMLAGKPVIATAYSGNLDFTLPGETLLVAAPRRPIREGEFLYAGPAQAWGEPDVEQAAAAMRAVRDDPALAARLGRSGRARVEADCSPDALAQRYARALQLHPVSAADASAPESIAHASHVQ